jgi:RecB family exonuclease
MKMETTRLDELLEECGGMDEELAMLRDLAAAELAALKSELEIKQSLLDEAIRKGMILCEQNGTLLMEAHAMKSRLAEAHAAINKILSVQDGTTDGDAFTTSEGCYSCDEKDEIARAFIADKQEKRTEEEKQ